MDGGTFILAVASHPDRQQVRVLELNCRRRWRRWRLSALVARYAGDLAEPAVWLNGQDITDSNLKRLRIKPGDRLLLCPQVGLWAALWYAAAWLFWKVAVPAAIAYGVGYAAGELFGSDLPDADDAPGGQSFAFEPRSAQREGGVIPWEFGQNMNHGTIVAKWTDVDATGFSSEILYMIVCFGEGPTEGNLAGGIYLNDRPITDYSGVTTEERKGTWSQTAMTNFPHVKLESRIEARVTYSGGPVVVTMPRSGFDDIEFTWGFMHGAWKVSKGGEYSSNGHAVKVEIAEVGGGYTQIYAGTVTDYQRAPLYVAWSVEDDLSYTVDRTKQYKLRFTKTGGDIDVRRADNVTIRSVRGVVDIAFTYPGRALVGIKAVATAGLSGNIDVKCEREGRICLYYNGSAWALGYRAERAWGVYNALVQPCITGDGGGTAYAVDHVEGFTQAQLDSSFFYEYAQMCDDQVDDGNGGTEDLMPLHHIFDSAGQLWQSMHGICQIGRAHLVWDGSILTGWVDQAWSGSEDLITAQDIEDLSWKDGWAANKKPAGTINVWFQDAAQAYKRLHHPVHNNAAGRYQNVVSIEAIGCKSRGMAERIGLFALARNALVRSTATFTMSKPAVRYEPGDVHPIQRSAPNWGESYRVRRYAGGRTIEVDRTVVGAAGDKVYVRAFNAGTGNVQTHSYTLDRIHGSRLTIAEAFTLQPICDDVVAVGSTAQIAKYRIKGIEWTSDHKYEITVENYDSTLGSTDSGTPVVPYPGTTLPAVRNQLDRTITWQAIADYVQSILPPALDVDMPMMNNITWGDDDPSSGYVSWSATTAGEDLEIRYKGTAYSITAGSDNDKFIYWIPGNTVFSHTATDSTMQTALVNGAFMVCLNDSGTAHPAQGVPLLWAGLLQAGTITASLGLIDALAVNTLEIADNAVTIFSYDEEATTSGLYASPDGSGGHGCWRVCASIGSFTSTGAPVMAIFDCEIDTAGLTGGAWFSTAVFRTVVASDVSISNVNLSGTNPVQITTSSAHGLSTGNFVWIWGVVGTTELNASIFEVTVIDTTHFNLDDTRSDWFTAYTSGGTMRQMYFDGGRVTWIPANEAQNGHINISDPDLDDGEVYTFAGCVRNAHATIDATVEPYATLLVMEVKK